MNRSATIGELRGLLDIASDDELSVARTLFSALVIQGAVRDHRHTENQLSGDGHSGDYERGYRKGWNDAMRSLERIVSAPPSGPSTEFASAGGGATTRSGIVCADCGETGTFVAQHKPDCPWRVIVPGKGE